MATSLHTCLKLAEYFKADRSLRHNHISNGMINDLDFHRKETEEIIGYIIDDGDDEFLASLRDDLDQINKAINLYT